MDIFAQPWLLPVICFAGGYLLARVFYRGKQTGPPSPRTDISDAEIEAELRMGHKVEAIKLCRQKYGCDLKTAVDEINTRSAKLGLRP
jgi:ribosomal protein L7/L12